MTLSFLIISQFHCQIVPPTFPKNMFLRYNFYTICWAILMLLLTIATKGDLPKMNQWDLLSFDKFAHFTQFCILIFLMIVGFHKQHTFSALRYRPIQISLVICLVYAIILEILQLLLATGRSFDITDAIANILGCFGGLLIFYLIYKI